MSSPFIVPDCTQQVSGRIADREIIVLSSEQLLERLAHGKLIVPNCQLEIMPVLEETKAEIIYQLGIWCHANVPLVGQFGGSNASIMLGSFKVPNVMGGFDILGPDASVVLRPRWNAFQANRSPRQPENKIFRKLHQTLS
ncbi:804_t:CDS:2 [Ambispora gerdemannii]|uniref:804_t:CDS:1 n=1 Tax=Ambispora gerdemannii TaxID=144530 RepID=A0A9N9C3P4_9GLOM|nr:804_t:CDS:2 [Ambispora gerdemannii]